MQEIRAFPVDKGSVALWWLGQNGYLFKTPEGTLLATDMYLTNNCAHAYHDSGIDLNRRVPILIPPEELEIDIYACTHNHLDHTDPVTSAGFAIRIRRSLSGRIPVAKSIATRAWRLAVSYPPGRTASWSAAISGYAGPSRYPPTTTDLNHMGYVFEFGSGPRVYMTGDTDIQRAADLRRQTFAGPGDHLHQRRLQQPLALGGGPVGGQDSSQGGDSVPLRYVPRQCR